MIVFRLGVELALELPRAEAFVKTALNILSNDLLFLIDPRLAGMFVSFFKLWKEILTSFDLVAVRGALGRGLIFEVSTF